MQHARFLIFIVMIILGANHCLETADMNKYFAIALCVTLPLLASAQKFSKDSVATTLAQLEAEEQLDYFNANFVSIYSADLPYARQLAEQMVGVAAARSLKEKEAYCRLHYGVALYLTGDYEAPLSQYLRAVDIFDSLGNQKGLARVYNELSVYYHKTTDPQKAFATAEAAEQAAMLVRDSTALATSVGLRGSFLAARGDLNAARPFYLRAYEINRLTNDSIALGYSLNDLAELELADGRIEQAIAYINKSTQIRERIGDVQGVAINLVNIGETYLAAGDYNRALPYLNRCLQKALPLAYTDLIRYTYDKISECYVGLGDYRLAFRNQQQAQVIGDSLLNLDKARVIAELQTKYETEKKDLELQSQKAALLEKDLQIQQSRFLQLGLGGSMVVLLVGGFLVRSRMQLRHQVELETERRAYQEDMLRAVISSVENERKRFSEDLHDSFGQLISILKMNVDSLSGATGGVSQSDRQRVFDQSVKVLNDMYGELKSVCFNLMPKTLTQHGLVAAIQELAQRINQGGKISVEPHFYDLDGRLSDIQEISFYRIVQEWTSNILKYSDASHVTIQLTRDDTEVTLTVEDDGAGFDVNTLKYGKGNGWKNLQSRTNLMKGQLDLETTPGRKGNMLIVNVPLAVTQLEKQTQAA